MDSPPPRTPTSPTKMSSQVLPELPLASQPEYGAEDSHPESTEDENMAAGSQSKQSRQTSEARSQMKTPEPQLRFSKLDGQTSLDAQGSPSTPGHIPPFDWDEFENRYEQALAEANEQEKEMLEEFDRLVKYFNVWASASSAHDNERAIKRLQTRERYVKIAEQSLDQKKQHLTEVVRAFQSALALLSQ